MPLRESGSGEAPKISVAELILFVFALELIQSKEELIRLLFGIPNHRFGGCVAGCNWIGWISRLVTRHQIIDEACNVLVALPKIDDSFHWSLLFVRFRSAIN